MADVDVYTSGPLRGLPIRQARPEPRAHVHLTEADVDQWRDQVLFGGAVAGDLALNDQAVDDLVDWSDERPGRTGGAFVLVLGAFTAVFFVGRALWSVMA